MKIKTIMALVFTVAFLANTTFATTAPTTLAPTEKVGIKTTQKELSLNLVDKESQDVTISIEAEDGNEIFKESRLLNANLTRRYDLKNLEMGNYKLVIKKRYEKFIQPFTVEIGKINCDVALLEQIFLPHIQLKGSLLSISVPSFTKPDVTVKIYDNAGFAIYEAAAKTTVFSKQLDLSRLPKGAYIVEVKSYGDELEYFSIQL
jgi:hypothetical protein